MAFRCNSVRRPDIYYCVCHIKLQKINLRSIYLYHLSLKPPNANFQLNKKLKCTSFNPMKIILFTQYFLPLYICSKCCKIIKMKYFYKIIRSEGIFHMYCNSYFYRSMWKFHFCRQHTIAYIIFRALYTRLHNFIFPDLIVFWYLRLHLRWVAPKRYWTYTK